MHAKPIYAYANRYDYLVGVGSSVPFWSYNLVVNLNIAVVEQIKLEVNVVVETVILQNYYSVSVLEIYDVIWHENKEASELDEKRLEH